MLPDRHHLAALLGLALLTSLGAAVLSPTPPANQPQLAVLVVFDQLRGDYLERWAPLYAEGGFRRLCSEGAWFQNCHYPYSGTQTGPGHASIATGCSPERHGIVANEWYDRKSREEIYCVASPRVQLVPPRTGAGKPRAGSSPERLLVPTLADVIKASRGKVVSLSLKDRSAVLPGGAHPDACYWADDTGNFVTSTYYREKLHSWVAAFNGEKYLDRWLDTRWTRLRPELDYESWSGPDDAPGEGGRGLTRTFPHVLAAPLGSRRAFAGLLATSPFGNDVLLELTRRAILAERLGRRGEQDLLCVSFSSNDLVGHVWGPDSQEVLDITLRSDLIVRDLLAFLDEHVGAGRYVLALTADHGICPLPEVSRSHGLDARRVDPGPLRTRAEAFLAKTFPAEGQGPFIEKASGANIYLDRVQIRRRGLSLAKVQDALAGWLPSQEGVQTAYAAHRLQAGVATEDALGHLVRGSFYPERSGDVIVVEKPYYLFSGKLSTGTNHGTPHDYDRHVPLLVYGQGIPGGPRRDPVTPQAAAVILARALGLAAPAGAEAPVPAGLFR